MLYVLPADSIVGEQQGGGDLLSLLGTLWRGRWLIAAIVTACASVAVVYVLLATKWYRAETVLMPTEPKSMRSIEGALGSLGGLASLAGISIGGGRTSEPIAVLRSRAMTRAFIEEQNLLPILFPAEWDAKAGRWRASDPAEQPDVRDGVKYFEENIRSVQEDKRTGIVTIAIEWTDPKLAAHWANQLAQRANERMRERALTEAQGNVDYLRRELENEKVVGLQQSISRLLEGELQKVMLARGNEEFAFRYIDHASEPKREVWPKRLAIVAYSIIGSGLLAVLIVFAVDSLRTQREARRRAQSAAG